MLNTELLRTVLLNRLRKYDHEHAQRVVVDPITRIEGHLRIEAETDARARITQASSAGTMVRGIEIILRGRDPRDAWAFAQRICGVCTLVHGIASVRSVEDALQYEIPRQRAIDPQSHDRRAVRARSCDALLSPACARLGGRGLGAERRSQGDLGTGAVDQPYPKSSPGYFADVQKKLKNFVEGGQLGIFANGYWGHPAYKLPPEANLMAVAHYLEALAWQRDVSRNCTPSSAARTRIRISWSAARRRRSAYIPDNRARAMAAQYRGGMGATAVNMVGLQTVKEIIDEMRDFVDQVYVPDTLAIAGVLQGLGCTGRRPRQFHDFRRSARRKGMDDPSTFLMPRGVILDRDLTKIHPMDLNAEDRDPGIRRALLVQIQRRQRQRPASVSRARPNSTTPARKPPYEHLDTAASYSWLKSPRWQGKAVEVGPLARVLMMYATGNEQAKELVDSTLQHARSARTGAVLNARPHRRAHAGDQDRGRCHEAPGTTTSWPISRPATSRTFNEKNWDPSTWPSTAKGVGFMEAPRGALAHWIVIKDGKIDNYQAVVPSTWNAGPRDVQGQDGAYEAALQGHCCTIPNSRSRSCAPSTASIPASPARCM